MCARICQCFSPSFQQRLSCASDGSQLMQAHDRSKVVCKAGATSSRLESFRTAVEHEKAHDIEEALNGWASRSHGGAHNEDMYMDRRRYGH